MVEVAQGLDRWNCPYLKLECHSEISLTEIKELCEVRNYSECLLVNGDRCEVFEEWLKENG